jgi:hypothetical protein
MSLNIPIDTMNNSNDGQNYLKEQEPVEVGSGN